MSMLSLLFSIFLGVPFNMLYFCTLAASVIKAGKYGFIAVVLLYLTVGVWLWRK